MPLFRPRYRFHSVVELTEQRLQSLQIEAILLDVDCTLKVYGSSDLEPQIESWLAMRKAENIPMCIVSNGGAARVRPFAERIGLPFVAPAFKPFPFGMWKAAKILGVPLARTALVGDQIFTDVMAANLTGAISVLVSPIHPELEPRYARWKRPIENIVLKNVPFNGE